MSNAYKVWEFPKLPVSAQVFYVPGAAVEGGMTSGGARIVSPDPGGRAVLEVELSLRIAEYQSPVLSWLMSKTNGQIFRIPLTRTPQLAFPIKRGDPLFNGIPWDNGLFWDDGNPWAFDFDPVTTMTSLEGSNSLTVNISKMIGSFPMLLQPGHVIGHLNCAYIIDEISYAAGIVTCTVNPPLRNNVASGDTILLEPYFTGTIANAAEFKATYDAGIGDNFQPGKLTFREVIL